MNYRFPESCVFYRKLNHTFPGITYGNGPYLFDETGKRYLDAVGGAAVVNLGHGVSEIAQAVAQQMGQVAYVNGTQFTHQAVEQLAQELAEVLPENLTYSYFLCSGSEAIEACVKLARQYWQASGKSSKWKVISRVPSYHGNTLTALSLSGREHYRTMFGPLLTEFPRIPAPDTYRHPDSPASTGEVLEQEILKQGPDSVAAFLVEPIIGSSLGAMVPTPEYYRRVQEICRTYQILFIADEVMAGMGRTGRWFSFEHFDLQPDVLAIGKGLSGGYAPLSAVVASKPIVDLLAQTTGSFNHAQTYSHTPTICAAGLATIRYLKKHALVERCRAMEQPFFAQLSELKAYPVIGDIRGKGLLAGIEIVQNRDTQEPFPRSAKFAERFTARAFQNGLIVWPNVGHVDGINGDLILLAPPFIITEEHLSELVTLFKQSLEQTLAE